MNVASAYIRKKKNRKFFLFLHFYDPHWPYHPRIDIAGDFYRKEPTPELIDLHGTQDYYEWVVKALKGPEQFVEFSRAMYEAEISYVDLALERLFTNLANAGMINRTVIIVTSDHGEEFKEHGLMGHGLTLYDEVLRVPLIVRYPRVIPKETRLSLPVQIAVTVAALACSVSLPLYWLSSRRPWRRLLTDPQLWTLFLCGGLATALLFALFATRGPMPWPEALGHAGLCAFSAQSTLRPWIWARPRM